METKQLVLKLFDALSRQDYSLSEKVSSSIFSESYEHKGDTTKKIYNYLHEMDLKLGSVSYDHIDKSSFQRDLNKVQEYVSEEMLFAYGYKSGNLSIIGIIFADSLNDNDLRSIFSRLDESILNTMRKHVGHVYGGNNGGTWGTMMVVFSDSNKARHFNDNISTYYNSHFLKSCSVSSICIDCASNTLTQGKAALGLKWRAGLDIEAFRRDIFGN